LESEAGCEREIYKKKEEVNKLRKKYQLKWKKLDGLRLYTVAIREADVNKVD